jgi:hypothetical protein
MALSFVNKNEGVAASSPAVITKPTGVVENDFMLFMGYTSGDGYHFTCADWAEVAYSQDASFNCRTVLWKRAGASEGASYSFACAGGSPGGLIVAYRGVYATGDPILASSNTAYETSNTTLRAASLTTAEASLLIHCGWAYSGPYATMTKPADYTARVDYSSATIDSSIFASDKEWTSSGATGVVDATLSQTTAYKHAFLVAVKLAGAAAFTGLTVTKLLNG